jgi:hypothetical protein
MPVTLNMLRRGPESDGYDDLLVAGSSPVGAFQAPKLS